MSWLRLLGAGGVVSTECGTARPLRHRGDAMTLLTVIASQRRRNGREQCRSVCVASAPRSLSAELQDSVPLLTPFLVPVSLFLLSPPPPPPPPRAPLSATNAVAGALCSVKRMAVLRGRGNWRNYGAGVLQGPPAWTAAGLSYLHALTFASLAGVCAKDVNMSKV